MNKQQFCEQLLAAMRAGDNAAMSQMLHPEFEVQEASGLPYQGTYVGLDGWITLCRVVSETWKRFRLELIEYAGEYEDTLVTRFAISGQSRKTGKAFDSSVMELWRFKDNKLFRIYPYYFDTHLLACADTADSEAKFA